MATNAAASQDFNSTFKGTRHPTLDKNCIYLCNLPFCTREELESICHPYGNILSSLMQQNSAFVQFESEEDASKCIAALNKSTFKSNVLNVRNASTNPNGPHNGNSGGKNYTQNAHASATGTHMAPMSKMLGAMAAAARDSNSSNYNITRDPALVKNRIFLGNLPLCTREELESICHPYGNVLGSLVQKNFGFVQFDSEDIANQCAAALNKSTFKSNVLTVRNASTKPKGPNKQKGQASAAGVHISPMTTVQGGLVMSAAAAAAPINDCEIIVINRENTKYAEYVEDRLKKCGMRVDVLFPNEDVMLGQVLSNISARGCLYAILVTPQHEALNSITVNILYGVPAEHRNMPLDDAITLISTNFRLKKQRDAVTTTQIYVGQNRHPENMQQLIEMLADNRPLTGLQYECIIKYLQEQHEKQLKVELGEANALAKLQATDPEIELQKRILNIMNKPAVTESKCELMYSSFETVKSDNRLMELLQDIRVIRALESVYSSDLIETISQYL